MNDTDTCHVGTVEAECSTNKAAVVRQDQRFPQYAVEKEKSMVIICVARQELGHLI
jgi:hypothetical protein